MTVAKVASHPRWSKKEILYKWLSHKSDFGWGSSLSPEGTFDAACSKWAEHCGLTFRQTEGDDADIKVSWASLGKDPKGSLIGGDTTPPEAAPPVSIRFSTDVTWVGLKTDPNVMDFFYVALHEVGHAIGMEHSSDAGAIMYERKDRLDGFDWTPGIFQGLYLDDAVGARYLYSQPPWDKDPGWAPGDKSVLLVNMTNDDVNYSVYVTGDGAMKISLGGGSIKPGELTFWPEKQDVFNFKRLYRVKVECKGQTVLDDDVPPKAQVTVWYDYQHKLDGGLHAFVSGPDKWGPQSLPW
jgi:hypothetical protein